MYKECNTRAYYDMARDEQPCCGCVDGENYEEGSKE